MPSVTEYRQMDDMMMKILKLRIFPVVVIVKFDTYQNLQLHRAVLPMVARLSCY